MSARIDKLKAQLGSGSLSQADAEAVAQKIRNLGGKVALANFGYKPINGGGGAGAVTDPGPTPEDVANATNAAKPIKDPGSVYTADQLAEMDESQKQIIYQNPDIKNPFGNQETRLNPDGTVSVNQELSPEQQKILEQGQGLTQQGQSLASNILGGYKSFQGPEYDRTGIEEAVYNRLMRGQEEDYNQSVESKKQELYNKGIPYSNDPNSRYQQELGDINRRYDEQKLQARSQATAQGASEYGQAFNQGLVTHQQGLADLGTLQAQGTGLQLPQFQSYQGPNYDVADPSSYIYAGKELKQGNKQFNLEKDALAQQTAIANKQLAAASAASQPQAPQPPPFP